MKIHITSLAMAVAVLLAGCSQQAAELEQVRMNKEKVETTATELKSPYKEIKAYFESEDADSEVVKEIEEIPGFPLMDHVKGGTGASVAVAGMGDMKRIKEVNEFEPLDEWLTKTERLFEEAFESGDEEVEYDKLGEAQQEIEKVQGFILKETDK